MGHRKYIKHGDIRYCNLPEIENSSVQCGMKACIIIQNNIGNKHSECVNVIPITSKYKKMKLPCHILVHGDRLSVVLTEQIRTIPKRLVINEPPITKLSTHDMERVKRALLIQMGFEEIPRGKELYDFQHDYDKQYNYEECV